MGFLDNLSKTLSTGTDRVKFEAEKFQRTTKINGEIANLNAQVDTNLRQLGERALELYQQGSLHAPEVASLAQILTQLRDQVSAKQKELEEAQGSSFESQQPADASQGGGQTHNVPITSESGGATHAEAQHAPAATHSGHPAEHQGSLPPATSVPVAGTTPYACTNCGYSLPEGSVFCPNCGTRRAGA